MKHRSRSNSLFSILGIILVMVLVVGFVLLALTDGLQEPAGPDPDLSPLQSESTDPEQPGSAPSGPVASTDRYYHQPVLITDDVTQGCGLLLWDGLSRFMEQLGWAAPPEDAVCLCPQTADSIAAAIDLAEREVVPSVILLHGSEAAQAVASRMDTYAGTQFMVFDAVMDCPASNVCCIELAAEQAGFLAGYGLAMDGLTTICCWDKEEQPEDQVFLAGLACGAEAGAAIQGTSVTIQTVPASGKPPAGAAVCSGSLHSGGVELLLQWENGELTPLTTISLRLDNVAASALQQWAAGGWEQFYGGKCLRYDLSWGTTVAASTEPWGFAHFSTDLLHQAEANLAMGSYTARSVLPDDLQHVTICQ